MSFTDVLNESMESSPRHLDPNIDPALQGTPFHRHRQSQILRTPSGPPHNTPNDLASTPWASSEISNVPCTRPTEPAAGQTESSSSDEDEETIPLMTETQSGVCQLAQQNNLSQANTQEAMNFATLYRQKSRDLRLYCKLLALEQAIGAGTSWTPSADAMRNIQRYCNSVLLSPELPTYRSSATTRIVMDVLKNAPSQLPSGWVGDPHKTALVMKSVSGYLTQGRSDMKKKLLASIAPVEDDSLKVDIAELADGLASNTITITAALWARVSFLHRVLGTDAGATFWKNVDTELKKLRDQALEKAKGDEEKAKKKLHRLFKNLLEIDYQLYGNPALRRTAPSQGPLQEWQKAADTAASSALALPVAHKRKTYS